MEQETRVVKLLTKKERLELTPMVDQFTRFITLEEWDNEANGKVERRLRCLPADAARFVISMTDPFAEDLHEKRDQFPFETDYRHVSSIDSRNWTEFSGFPKKVVSAILIEWLQSQGKVRVYAPREVEIFDTDEFYSFANSVFAEAVNTRIRPKVEQAILSELSTKDVVAIKYDGTSGVKLSEIKVAGYRLMESFEIGGGKDHRFNRGHLKLGYFLPKLPEKDQKVVQVKLPKDLFGRFIGKGGKNIKSIEKWLGGKKIQLIEGKSL